MTVKMSVNFDWHIITVKAKDNAELEPFLIAIHRTYIAKTRDHQIEKVLQDHLDRATHDNEDMAHRPHPDKKRVLHHRSADVKAGFQKV